MELYTIGYEGRTLPQFVRALEDNGVTRLVDVRERPQSRKKGFSARGLFDALLRAGITYESDKTLGNPVEIRDLWKNGELEQGKHLYRKMLRNGRGPRVQLLVELARYDRVCILCYEETPDACHRSIIAEEATRLEPSLTIHHL
jgi:uncharacterized protein (DUF488 family)